MKVEVKIVALAFIALSFYIDKSLSIVIPVRNPTCIYQTDLYDANNNYLKSVCYVDKQEYRDTGVESCDAMGMKIMDADDGSINVLIAIFNKLMPSTPGGSAWVGGGSGESCSIMSWVSLGNWQRVNAGCNNAYRGTVCEFNGLMPPVVSKPKPAACDIIKDIFDVQGKYLKTLCHVKYLQSHSNADNTCQAYSMALANPNEISSTLIAGAKLLYPNGARVWLSGNSASGCSAVQSPSAAAYYMTASAPCDLLHPSFCEYNKFVEPTLATTTEEPTTTTTTVTTTMKPVPRAQPSVCDNIQDVYDNAGNYVKTLCNENVSKSQFVANENCIYNGMELANPNEYVGNLKSFAAGIHTGGGWIWLNQKNDLNCTVLTAPLGTNAYVVENTHSCYAKYVSFCEYNKFVPFVNSQPATTLSTNSPQRHASCYSQKDHYDASGNYLKTVCSHMVSTTRDGHVTACESFGMSIANPDDHRESLGVLITRANHEFHSGGMLWTKGSQNGKCSALIHQSFANYERKWVDCNTLYAGYCEFNKNLQ